MDGEICEERMLKGELSILGDEQKSGQSEFIPNRKVQAAGLQDGSRHRAQIVLLCDL